MNTSMPLNGGLGTQAPGSSAVLKGCPGGARTKRRGSSWAAPLPSIFGLPGLGSLGWLSSLSLVSGLGSVLHFPRSSLQVDKQDSEFLPSAPPPDRDPCGLYKQATDYF